MVCAKINAAGAAPVWCKSISGISGAATQEGRVPFKDRSDAGAQAGCGPRPLPRSASGYSGIATRWGSRCRGGGNGAAFQSNILCLSPERQESTEVPLDLRHRSFRQVFVDSRSGRERVVPGAAATRRAKRCSSSSCQSAVSTLLRLLVFARLKLRPGRSVP
jgi:hypothetical protein